MDIKVYYKNTNNNATTKTSKKIVDDLPILKSNISKQLPICKILLSKPIIRHDEGGVNLMISNFDKYLSALQSECNENDKERITSKPKR